MNRNNFRLHQNFLFTVAGVAMFAACGGTSDALTTNEDPTEQTDEDLSSNRYRLKIGTNPSPVESGTRTTLNVTVTAADRSHVTKFDLLHTKPMHLIGVSSDLSEFMHIHPDLQGDGTLVAKDVKFYSHTPFSFFAEFDPAGQVGYQLAKAKVSPSGSHVVKPTLSGTVFDGSKAITLHVGNMSSSGATNLNFSAATGGMIMPKTATTIVVDFRDMATGKPVTDLVDWLGMPAHAIAVSEDLKSFIHAHGMPANGEGGGHDGMGGMGGMDDMSGMNHSASHGSSTSKSTLAFDVNFPKAGSYKVWVQFQRGSQLLTTPLIVNVMSM